MEFEAKFRELHRVLFSSQLSLTVPPNANFIFLSLLFFALQSYLS